MSQWITPDVRDDAPPPRNLTQELNAIYGAQARFAPQTLALAQQNDPQYNRIAIGNLGETVLGWTGPEGHHPGTLELNTAANTVTRGSDLADVERLGPEATAAYLAANPDLATSRSRLVEQTAPSPLLGDLNQIARAGLASNGQLSAQDLRGLDQQTLGLYAQNGMTGGNPALGAQLLSRDAAQRARIAAAQQVAFQVQGLNTNQAGVTNAATSTLASTLADPYQSVIGRTSGAVGSPNYNSNYRPPDITGYGQDLFNTNYNAGVNLAIQQSNAEANTRSSIAQIASSFSDRRLKKNIVIIGRSPMGIEIAEFEYDRSKLASLPEGRWRGAIAQQVQEIKPSAVMRSASDGYLRVRYSEIDVPLERLGGARSKIVTKIGTAAQLQIERLIEQAA